MILSWTCLMCNAPHQAEVDPMQQGYYTEVPCSCDAVMKISVDDANAITLQTMAPSFAMQRTLVLYRQFFPDRQQVDSQVMAFAKALISELKPQR